VEPWKESRGWEAKHSRRGCTFGSILDLKKVRTEYETRKVHFKGSLEWYAVNFKRNWKMEMKKKFY
jgi:hypothetical protein